MHKKMRTPIYLSFLCLVLCETSGCATYNLNEKINSTYYKGTIVNYVSDAFYDNDDIDKLYICFSGQEVTGDSRKEDNRHPVQNYVAIIDGFTINKLGKSTVSHEHTVAMNCHDYIQHKNVSRLNIYMASKYKYFESTNSCGILNWKKDGTKKEILIVPQKKCDYSYDGNNYEHLTSTIQNNVAYNDGFYVVYKHDAAIRNKEFVLTNNTNVSTAHIKHKKGVHSFYIPGKRLKTNPMSPFLLPLTLVYDLVTLPLQAIYFLVIGYHE